MGSLLTEAAPVAVFALACLAIWLGGNAMMDRAGGWGALASCYRMGEPYHGPRWWFSSGEFKRSISCRGCLTVGANPEGLYLAMIGPFTPALFIPWPEITVTTGTRFGFLPYVEFSFQRVPAVPLRVHRRLGRRIAWAAGSAWPGPPADSM
jgi:hypothetical protein